MTGFVICRCSYMESRDSSVGIALDDRDFLGFDSRRVIFLFTTVSGTALGSTQPIQCIPGALSLGVKRPGREASHSLPSSAEVKG
jgi:hypothetical protein